MLAGIGRPDTLDAMRQRGCCDVRESETNPGRAAAVVIEWTGRRPSFSVHRRDGDEDGSRCCTRVSPVGGVEGGCFVLF